MRVAAIVGGLGMGLRANIGECHFFEATHGITFPNTRADRINPTLSGDDVGVWVGKKQLI